MSGSARTVTVEIGNEVLGRLAGYCRARGFDRLRIVADGNTWPACGMAAAARLEAAGLDVAVTRLDGTPAADANALRRISDDEAADRTAPSGEGGARIPIAVGSGTITDIVRYHATQRGRSFISVPTAASVDAYASSVAALVVDGAKVTLPASQPEAIFADLGVLAAAPPLMTAAGFGDIVCKPGALADWRLGALVWDEPWDPEVALRMLSAAESCIEAAPSIGRRQAEGVAALMRGLLASGAAMAELGHSRPASGAEHHLSHFWETKLAVEGRPAVLHGLKVGAASVMVAALWREVAVMGRGEAEARLASAVLPDPEAEEARLGAALGTAAVRALDSQRRFFALDGAAFRVLKQKILTHWDEISSIASRVPRPLEIEALLEAAGCPTTPAALGIRKDEVDEAWNCAHLLRDRFTIFKLARMLGLMPAGR